MSHAAAAGLTALQHHAVTAEARLPLPAQTKHVTATTVSQHTPYATCDSCASRTTSVSTTTHVVHRDTQEELDVTP